MSTIDDALALARQRQSLPTPYRRRQIRERAGLPQTAIAQELGTTSPTVSRWESGDRTPRGVMLGRYAALLARLAYETALDR